MDHTGLWKLLVAAMLTAGDPSNKFNPIYIHTTEHGPHLLTVQNPFPI